MPWLRVDDRMYSNKKFAPVSNDEIALWFWAMDYSADQLTNGHLTIKEVHILALMRGIADWQAVVDQLVLHRLFEPREGGYSVHDYLEYNPTAEKVLQDREDNARKQADYQAKKRADKPMPVAGVNARAGGTATDDGVATNALVSEEQKDATHEDRLATSLPPTPNRVSNRVSNRVPKTVPYPSPYPYPVPGPEPKKTNGAAAPLGADAPLSATALKFLEILCRKRFRNATQRAAFEALEAETGPDPIIRAATWAAENGILSFDSFRTTARKIAKGVKASRPVTSGRPPTTHERNMEILDEWGKEHGV